MKANATVRCRCGKATIETAAPIRLSLWCACNDCRQKVAWSLANAPFSEASASPGVPPVQRAVYCENAIVRTVSRSDLIVGPIAITWANAMLGEVTPRMAAAVTTSPAVKLLLPLFQENAEIIGVAAEPLPHLVQHLVDNRLTEVLAHV